MDFPICSLCVESESLCEKCRKKLADGSITESDASISRVVKKVYEKARATDGADIKKIIETNSFVLIACTEPEKMIGNDMVVKQISKEMGKPVKIIGDSADVRGVVQMLIEPTVLIGIDILYTESGEKLRARIPLGSGMAFHEADVKAAVSGLFRKEIVFARE